MHDGLGVRTGDPATAACAQLLENFLGLCARDDNLIAVPETRLEPLRSLGAASSRPQLLEHLVGLAPGKPDVAGTAKQLFQPLCVAHSWGFSGVPGRPSGNSSANLRATASGTSSSTFPPKEAISFTPLEETKLTCGLAIT